MKAQLAGVMVLAAVCAAPAFAAVKAGYRNRFGHPAPEVLARLAARGVPVADTVTCGALRWRSSAPAQWHCEREESRRYWDHRAR